MAKKKESKPLYHKTNMTNICPNCGKEVVLNELRSVKFCSRVCEVNYKYRMKHVDPRDGKMPSYEEVERF